MLTFLAKGWSALNCIISGLLKYVFFLAFYGFHSNLVMYVFTIDMKNAI